MIKTRLIALSIIFIGVLFGWFIASSQGLFPSSWASRFPFKLGLDLSGGTHLVYHADVSQVASGEINDSMNSLRDVIERRVNLFGVSEPLVQVEHGGIGTNGEERLLVDLPGVTDISQAVEMIGQTPLLEFKIEKKDFKIPETIIADFSVVDMYSVTELTGRYLDKAILEFDPNTQKPMVSLQFDTEGSKLFEEITRANVGKTVAIFLDGAPISTPVVNEAISGGKAVISGSFTPEEAKILVGRLNSGALPVPIELISTQTIGASLGGQAVDRGIQAALVGFIAVVLFLIFWYRLPGFVAVMSLCFYILVVLSIFKLIPVTLTAAGIAGFIISIGLAVDANVLINERIKEELRSGKSIKEAIELGFDRAWTSIRDSNTSSIITAIILYGFGTPLIKGFALTFFIGVFVSMFSASTISRIFMSAFGIKQSNKITGFLFGSGLSSARSKVK